MERNEYLDQYLKMINVDNVLDSIEYEQFYNYISNKENIIHNIVQRLKKFELFDDFNDESTRIKNFVSVNFNTPNSGELSIFDNFVFNHRVMLIIGQIELIDIKTKEQIIKYICVMKDDNNPNIFLTFHPKYVHNQLVSKYITKKIKIELPEIKITNKEIQLFYLNKYRTSINGNSKSY